MGSEDPPDGQRKAPLIVLRREPGLRAACAAVVGGRCPRCRRGKIFTGLMRMAPACEICALRFEREPGYFTGAMYVSYVIALPLFIGLFLGWRHFAPALSFGVALTATILCFLPFVPFVFRSSRILWIHIDRAIDADDS
jgi:uncharacterized protein (DUF983 family)